MPMRPVTPCMMIPSLWVAMAEVSGWQGLIH
jgi:hypothetical protein